MEILLKYNNTTKIQLKLLLFIFINNTAIKTQPFLLRIVLHNDK